MKLVMIILFFILIFLTMIIKIDIEEIEVINQKIFFKIKIKLYVFKYIKIFQKDIRKKDITKIISFSEKHKLLKKERKFLKKLYPKIEEFNLDLDYGIKNIFLNVYLYGIINTIIPCILAKFDVKQKDRKYKVNTNFKKNYLKIKFKSRIKFGVFNNIIKNAKAAIH